MRGGLFREFAQSVFVRVLGAVSGFLLSLVLGNVMGADRAGLYFLAFGIATFLSAIARVGLDNTVLRFTATHSPQTDWGRKKSVLLKALALSGAISLVFSVGLFSLSELVADRLFGKPELGPVLKWISPGILGLSALTLLAMSLQGLRKITASIVVLNIFTNLFLLLFLALVRTSPAGAAACFSVGSLLAAGLGAALLFSIAQSGTGTVRWKEIFDSCLPLWVVVFMAQLTQWSGQFISGVWVDSAELAQLAVAQRTALLISFVLMAVNLVVAPRFAEMYSKDDIRGIQSLAINSVRVMLLISFPCLLYMFIYPEQLMSLFGGDFAGGAALLQILAVGQFVNVATGSVGFLLSMSGHEKDLRNTVLVSGPVAIGLAVVLTPTFGVIGGALATAIALATQNLIAVWWVKRRLGFNTLKIWRI